MTSEKKIRDVHAALSVKELEVLKNRIKGYGWLTDSARRVGLHVNTLRMIVQKGYGMPENINKIRNILLRENSTHQQAKN